MPPFLIPLPESSRGSLVEGNSADVRVLLPKSYVTLTFLRPSFKVKKGKLAQPVYKCAEGNFTLQ